MPIMMSYIAYPLAISWAVNPPICLARASQTYIHKLLIHSFSCSSPPRQQANRPKGSRLGGYLLHGQMGWTHIPTHCRHPPHWRNTCPWVAPLDSRSDLLSGHWRTSQDSALHLSTISYTSHIMSKQHWVVCMLNILHLPWSAKARQSVIVHISSWVGQGTTPSVSKIPMILHGLISMMRSWLSRPSSRCSAWHRHQVSYSVSGHVVISSIKWYNCISQWSDWAGL